MVILTKTRNFYFKPRESGLFRFKQIVKFDKKWKRLDVIESFTNPVNNKMQ